jgi:hypothetical protein
MGINEGDQLAIVVQGQQINMRPFTRTLLDFRGIIKTTGPRILRLSARKSLHLAPVRLPEIAVERVFANINLYLRYLTNNVSDPADLHQIPVHSGTICVCFSKTSAAISSPKKKRVNSAAS